MSGPAVSDEIHAPDPSTYGLFVDCTEDDGITDEDFELHVLNDPEMSDAERVAVFDEPWAADVCTNQSDG